MKLICPVCRLPLIRDGRSAHCANRHNFDYASSGYLNLYPKNRKVHGDSPESVKARTAFLNTGTYAFLQQELGNVTRRLDPDVLADLGCGEGYYTKALAGREKYGFDLARDALITASRHDHDTQYVLSSIFQLPLPDACVDTAVTCFAPTAAEELMRILTPGGHFLCVTPGPDHLFELKEILYDTPYRNTVSNLNVPFVLQEQYMIRQRSLLDRDTLLLLFRMTPYAHHTPSAGMKRLEETEQLELTSEFVIRLYEKTR